MLKELTREEWIAITVGTDAYSIFIDPAFLEPVAAVFTNKLKYYIKFLKDVPVLGVACFTKGNKIIVPTHFIYSGIWWDIDSNTIKFRNTLIDLIAELKGKYRSIEFRLPPEITDIRPFQWEGFSHKANFTYTRKTSDLNFEYNIRSRVKKSIAKGIVPSLSDSFKNVWHHQSYDLKRFHFSDRLLQKLGHLFESWLGSGFMYIYEADCEVDIVGSSCVLYDKKKSRAYNLLISSANSNYHTGVHAALYNYIFKHLQSEGIKEFDLYGADLRGVADFKSSFDAQLNVHYTVGYNRNLAFINNIKQKVREKLVMVKSKIF